MMLAGLGLIGVYAAVEAAQRRRWQLAAAAAAGAAAALVNPYGHEVYAVPLSHWRDMGDLQAYIREWQGGS